MILQLLKETLVNRRDRWRKFQKHITSRARIQFFFLLSERGFRGKLLANHKEKKMDLLVLIPFQFPQHQILTAMTHLISRLSLMKHVAQRKVTVPRGCPVAKNRSQQSVYSSQCGKLWALQLDVSTSCKLSLVLLRGRAHISQRCFHGQRQS